MNWNGIDLEPGEVLMNRATVDPISQLTQAHTYHSRRSHTPHVFVRVKQRTVTHPLFNESRTKVSLRSTIAPRFPAAMSSQASESELSSLSESEAEYSIEYLSYNDVVAKLRNAKLDYYIHHTNMHAVAKTIFENRNVPPAARATTKVRIRVEDHEVVYESRPVALTDLQEEEEDCRRSMREAQAECRALESRRQELLKERKKEKIQHGWYAIHIVVTTNR